MAAVARARRAATPFGNTSPNLAAHGINPHVQLHKKLTAANWPSGQQLWRLTVDANGEKEIFHARFLVMDSGFYNYYLPRSTTIPGLSNFKSNVAYPQFWPEDFDFANKKVVIIGSSATAVTLLHSIGAKAASVTIFQSSPSYVASRSTSDFTERFVLRFFPRFLALKINRWKNILVALLVKWCNTCPAAARRDLKAATIKQLPPSISHSPHFEPKYNHWEQRFCLCPDRDFFTALRKGNVAVMTDTTRTMKEDRIVLASGKDLDADIIITATGLQILIAGGALISVDNEVVRPREKFVWKGTMLQDLPNAFFVIGYTDAS
jgi:cation diffusion facilitator CzcD-associated flavoprotein CzcO